MGKVTALGGAPRRLELIRDASLKSLGLGDLSVP